MVYWKRRLNRAFADTLAVLGFNRRMLLVSGQMLFIFALLLYVIAGEAVVIEEMQIAVATFGAFVVVFVGNFIWYYFTAPARMQAEADTKIENLEGTLAKISNKQAHVDELSNLLSSGIRDIWNNTVATDDDLAELATRWSDWQQEVIDVLEAHFTYSDKVHFARLGGVPPVTKPGVVVPGHQKIIQEYALKESRLREIIRDHNVTR